MATAEAGPAGGVYVHLPFCSRICPYCDFAVTVGGRAARRRLVDALIREVELVTPPEVALDTVYFGGGTPSLIDADDLARILAALRRHLAFEEPVGVFLEANPEDVDPARLEAWRALGVTTLSLGVQSLDDEALAFLGRRHDARGALEAVEAAAGAGFDTVSVDLIYARPGQRPDAWREELERAAELDCDHLSCYQLTVHPGTGFGRLVERHRLVEMPDEGQAELFLATHEWLARAGFEAYEVSNFARSPRHRSRHNTKYWTGAPYLGLGPSAHSYAAPRRWWNVAAAAEYMERLEAGRSPIASEELLDPGRRLLERVMLGLRTSAGVDLARLGRRYGVDLAGRNRRLLRSWSRRGRVELDAGSVRPTPSGWLVADRLAAELDLTLPAGRASA